MGTGTQSQKNTNKEKDMKNMKKIMSLFLALVMLVGVALPSVAMAEEVTKTESVTVHKILQLAENLNKVGTDKKPIFPGTKGLDGKEYDGNLIGKKNDNTQTQEEIKNALLGYFGAGSKDIGGVYFAWAKKDTDGKYYWIKTDGTFTDPKTEVNESELDKLPAGTFGGTTEKDKGKEFTTTNFKGEYKIYEIHAKSSYTGEAYFDKDGNELVKKEVNGQIEYYNGQNKVEEKNVIKKGTTLTDMKAVPVVITLPLVNNDGVVKAAHVYPKNTEDKPKIDKNFAKAKQGEKELEVADGFDAADTGAGIGAGAAYENYQKKKATAKAEIGKKIPYEVKTEIPAKSKLAEAHWDDKMTEGLTFNKDLKVTIDGIELSADKYTIDQDNRGFSLRLNANGLKEVNDKAAAVTVVLTYSATVNSKAIADIPEANDITFHYGNTPSKGNTPLPVKPKDGQVTVKKTWDDGVWAQGETATFELRDANTGELVTANDLIYTGSDTDTTAKQAFEAYKASFNATATIGYNATDGATHTWKYLNKDKSYKAVEISSTTPSDAEYTKAADGTIEVTNHKSNNPTPLNPTEPKVVVGGKKFVKTNQGGAERLAGAEFVVKNSENKYLTIKDADQLATEGSNLKTAKDAYDNAVKTWNDYVTANPNVKDEEAQVTIGGEQFTGKKAVEGKIASLYKAYNDALFKAANVYEWKTVESGKTVNDIANIVKLTSDDEGRFEITGLEYGTYKLEEIKAPADYAKLSGDVEFTVSKGSYTTIGDIDYNLKLKDGETQTKAQKIENKKVSIPQTGGIGTVIFTVVGISLMAGAFIAMRKRTAEEN